jgi:hypothetical protein
MYIYNPPSSNKYGDLLFVCLFILLRIPSKDRRTISIILNKFPCNIREQRQIYASPFRINAGLGGDNRRCEFSLLRRVIFKADDHFPIPLHNKFILVATQYSVILELFLINESHTLACKIIARSRGNFTL